MVKKTQTPVVPVTMNRQINDKAHFLEGENTALLQLQRMKEADKGINN
jgi:hypothetical protein